MWLNSYASFALQLFASSSHSQLNASAVEFARRYLWGDPDWLIHTRAGAQTSNETKLSHRWRERALLISTTVSYKKVRRRAGQRLAAAFG